MKQFLCGICVGVAFALFYYRSQTAAAVWLVLSLIPMLPFHWQQLAESHNKDVSGKEADR